jgi:hypothetical protein
MTDPAKAHTSTGNPGAGTGNPTTGTVNPGPRLMNPLQAPDIQTFLINIIQILVVFATPVIIAFIMYAGFLFVTAKGDTGQISDAKHALTWAVIGGVILLGAQAIITVIQNTVNALRAA